MDSLGCELVLAGSPVLAAGGAVDLDAETMILLLAWRSTKCYGWANQCGVCIWWVRRGQTPPSVDGGRCPCRALEGSLRFFWWQH
jgi:hypothetical protein